MSVSSPKTAVAGVVLAVAAVSIAAGDAAAQAPAAGYPVTVKRPVSDTYAGAAGPVKVSEDYRWLESVDEPDVKDWITAQNAATRRVLDGLARRPAIASELRELIGKAPVTRYALRHAGGRLFALKRQPPQNQPMLVVLNPADAADGVDAGERVVVDPNRRNEKGTTAIDWYVPSRDGKRVAVSLSDNGSEKGTLRVFDVASGDELPDIIPRVQNPTASGSVAWNADGSGLWYTRYPGPLERPKEDEGFHQQVWFHKLGTRSTFDTYAFGKELPRIAEIGLEASDDGRAVLANVRNGDGGQVAIFVRGAKDEWRQVAAFGDGFKRATFGPDGRVYAIAFGGSPRGRVVVMPANGASLVKAKTVVAESDAAVESIVPTASRIYVEALVGGPSELRAYTLDGKPLPQSKAEPVSTTTIGTRLAGDAVLVSTQSYVTPAAWYLVDPKRDNGRPVKTTLSAPPDAVVVPDVEVRRVMATSKDGTQVPMTIVARRGLATDGSAPTLLTSYGGYSISQRPRYSRRVLFWLRHGGVFAVANVRGGGEFGETWHLAGNLVNKQNVFDDFAAAARWLVDQRVTSPRKLAIEGGSNGGLLVGAALVQNPDLYAAVVGHVGIYDMLRVELTKNGAFNVTEFGTVRNAAQFDALYGYSPLHHVEDGRSYPAVLLLTGINDGRVEPWQSLKMTARLQAANPRGKPVLLRVAGDAGHGQGMSLSSAIEQDADVFAFLFEQLGVAETRTYLPVPEGIPAPQPVPTK